MNEETIPGDKRTSLRREMRPKSAHPKHRLPATSSNTPLPGPQVALVPEQILYASPMAIHETFSPYLRPLLQNLQVSPLSTNVKRSSNSWKADEKNITIRELLDWTGQEHIQAFRNRKKRKRKSVKEVHNKTSSKNQTSTCTLVWRFLGSPQLKTANLKSEGQEVTVFQQHCGGSNILLYRGKHLVGDTFSFPSRRVSGFPFSVTIFLDGVRDLRLSTCCESRYPVGARLGGTGGHFQVVAINLPERTLMCLRCEAERCLNTHAQFPRPSTAGTRKPGMTKPKNEIVILPQNIPTRRAVPIDDVRRRRPQTPDVDIILEPQVYPEEAPSFQNSKTDDEVLTESEAEEIMENSKSESEEDSEGDIIEDVVSAYRMPADTQSQPGYGGDIEDQICGEYQSAEYNADSDEDEIDEETGVSEEDGEKEEEENGEDEVFEELLESPQDTNVSKTKSNGSDELMLSRRSRVRLPESHWGARHSPQRGSFSSDEEAQPINPVTEVQADVHVNASRSGSVVSYH